MNKLDKTILAWGKGNKKAKVGALSFTKTHIFYLSDIVVAARYRDSSDNVVIFIASTMPHLFDIDKHFKNKRCFIIDSPAFRTITTNCSIIEKTLALKKYQYMDAQLLGNRITEIKLLLKEQKVDVSLYDVIDASSSLLGSKSFDRMALQGASILSRGKAEAICARASGWKKAPTGGKLLSPVVALSDPRICIFAKLEDAVLAKMKGDDVLLYDISS